MRGRYGFLGPEGSFAHAAAQALTSHLSSGAAELVPLASVAEAVDAVRAATVAGALVPLENSVEGSVPATLDELAAPGTPLVIVAETYLPVVFDLLVRPGTPLAAIGTVATHPHAAAQVRRYLLDRLPAAKVIPMGSTAGGAEAVAEGHYDAAVAPAAAGRRYGLQSLAHDIGDNPAVTRFVLLGPPSPPPQPTGNDRTTVLTYLKDNHAGALLEILTEFAARGINLTRIESRPTKGRMGQYCFSIDCEGHVGEARVGDALAALHRICADVRYLGSYPRSDGAAGRLGEVQDGRTDADFAEAAGWLDRVRATGTG